MIYFKKLLAINILFVFAMGISAPAWSFDEMQLQRCLALKKCEGADLSGADLSGAKLKAAKLDKVILCKTKFSWGIENDHCK